MSSFRLALALPLLTLAACTYNAGPSKGCGSDCSMDDDDILADDTDDTPAPGPGVEDTDYGARGEHAVGHTILDVDGAVLKAWYPTASDAPEEITYMAPVRLFGPDTPDMPFLGNAIADAAPDTDAGPFPLVVLSHGFGMTPEWYHPLAEHLASRGMVVLAPDHVEYDWATDVREGVAYRPLEVSEAIDIAETGILDDVILLDRVAVVGHSLGGTTALSIGGARLHTAWLTEHCATVEDPFTEAYFCTPFLGEEDDLAALMGLSEVPEGLWPDLSDPRVDTIVAMAPDAGMFGEVGLAELEVPTMILAGTGDTGSPWEWGGGLAWDHMSSRTRARVTFDGGEHFLMTTTCDRMPWTESLPAEYQSYFCEDPAWDKAEALELVDETTAAWLDFALVGDGAGRDHLATLSDENIDGLGVLVETETLDAPESARAVDGTSVLSRAE